MIGRLSRVSLAVSLAVLTALAPVVPVFAQQQGESAPPAQPQPAPAQPQRPTRTIPESNQDYTHGKRWFPHILAPYTPTFVPEPILTNALRIEPMVQDGKLRISLQDAVDLAFQNNLAIAVQGMFPGSPKPTFFVQ